MSVPEGKRGESKLDVFVKAKALATYTIMICCNEKIFLPKHQNALTDEIIKTSEKIFVDCWSANNIKVIDKDTYKERCYLQKQAHRNCNNLIALIQIAQGLFHLKTKRLKYWGQMILDVRKLIAKWNESDRERYKQYK